MQTRMFVVRLNKRAVIVVMLMVEIFHRGRDDVRGCDRDDGDDLSDNLMRKAIYSWTGSNG